MICKLMLNTLKKSLCISAVSSIPKQAPHILTQSTRLYGA